MPKRESDTVKDNDPARIQENDLRKLHAEINQIVSQRFNLTTLAVVIFAAICGWATSTIAKDKTITPNFVALVAVLLQVVLASLYAYFLLLLGMMRIFTIYITEKYKSPWEREWQQYRNLPDSRTYWGYSKAGTFVFQVLGFLSILFPLGLLLVGGNRSDIFSMVLVCPIVIFALYEFVIYFATKYRDRIFSEASIARNWQDAIQRAANQAD